MDLDNRKNIKIIGLDLDGTLLDPEKKITSFTRETLAEAAARGIEIVPTTGRYFSAMPECVRELPFLHYSVNINGASVEALSAPEGSGSGSRFCTGTGKKLYAAEIPLAEALEIMEFLDQYPVIYDCYMEDHGFITASFKDRTEEFVTDPHYIRMVRELRESVPELKAYLRERGKDIQKIQFFTADHAFQQEMLLHGAERFPDVICTCSVRDQNVEFNHRNANKGAALLALAERLGFGAENLLTFGDGSNDVPMLLAAGTGVAMANASQEALAAADYTALSNTEDGVAKFIREFCF